MNEVDPDGRVLHFTDMKAPVIVDPAEQVPTMSVDESVQFLTELCGSDCAESVSGAYQHTDRRKDFSFVTQPMADKEQRTRLHQCIKAFGGVFDSKTVENNCIQIVPLASLKRKGGQKKKQLPGKFCQFLLYKENNNTQEALGRLARFLKFVIVLRLEAFY